MPKSATECDGRAVWVSGHEGERSLANSAFSAVLREYGIYIILVIITLAFSFTTKGFATINNLILILLQASVMGIISVGMLFVIVSKGIDLSVGSILGLSGGVTALLLSNGVPIPVAILVGLVLGLVVGLINGLLVIALGATT